MIRRPILQRLNDCRPYVDWKGDKLSAEAFDAKFAEGSRETLGRNKPVRERLHDARIQMTIVRQRRCGQLDPKRNAYQPYTVGCCKGILLSISLNLQRVAIVVVTVVFDSTRQSVKHISHVPGASAIPYLYLAPEPARADQNLECVCQLFLCEITVNSYRHRGLSLNVAGILERKCAMRLHVPNVMRSTRMPSRSSKSSMYFGGRGAPFELRP